MSFALPPRGTGGKPRIASLGVLCAFVLGSSLSQDPPKIEETEYDRDYAKVVRAYEAAEKLLKTDPAAALKALEEQVLPALPKLVETSIVVRFSKGAAKGAEKERHDFFPWRLAGECALAAGRHDRAVEHLMKSPSSRTLLEKAQKALAEGAKKPPPPPLQKPGFPLAPFLERRDYLGALEALRPERDRLGGEYEPLVTQVRSEAARHARAAAASFAAALPRLKEPGFRKEHLDPCLASCARVPPDLETDELRWIRRLGEWMTKPDPAELDRLALAAAKLDNDYHVVCEQAQRARLAEIQGLVEEARRVARADRQGVLERLDRAERSFAELSKAKEVAELASRVADARARLPVDSQVLDQARRGAPTVREARVLASQLDLLWTSPDRAKLGDQDQRDLAMHLGVYRATSLLLDGRSVEEAARDPRVAEAFRAAGALPKDVSPRIVRVAELARAGK